MISYLILNEEKHWEYHLHNYNVYELFLPWSGYFFSGFVIYSLILNEEKHWEYHLHNYNVYRGRRY